MAAVVSRNSPEGIKPVVTKPMKNKA
jgi:hypothetical protein